MASPEDIVKINRQHGNRHLTVDISPVFKDPDALDRAYEYVYQMFEREVFDTIVAVESAGFRFASSVSSRMGIPLIIASDKKINEDVVVESSKTHHGVRKHYLPAGSVASGERVVIIADLMTHGRDVRAAVDLVTKQGGKVVKIGVFTENIEFDARRKLLKGIPVESMIRSCDVVKQPLPMRTVISTGKGGVGKTTTISSVATLMAREGMRVIVFDTDPSMNLAMTLGIPYRMAATITDDKAHINQQLEDEGLCNIGREIIEEHSEVNSEGIRVVIMGAIPEGGAGCLCSSIAVCQVLLNYLKSDACEDRYDIAFVDSQAGPEILGRGIAREFDCNLILTEPTPKSAEVSRQVAKMAKDLDVRNNLLIINKSESESDIGRMSELVGLAEGESVRIRYDRSVIDADRDNKLLVDAYPKSDAMTDIVAVKNRILRTVGL